jgi:hypothetical protein
MEEPKPSGDLCIVCKEEATGGFFHFKGLTGSVWVFTVVGHE